MRKHIAIISFLCLFLPLVGLSSSFFQKEGKARFDRSMLMVLEAEEKETEDDLNAIHENCFTDHEMCCALVFIKKPIFFIPSNCSLYLQHIDPHLLPPEGHWLSFN